MMYRLLPLILFVLLGALLAVGLKISDTKTHIPSPLIGRQVPDFDLPTLFEPERKLTQKDFLGEPWLINFWGSWCPTCVFEHPVITDLARTGRLRIVGLNFRDEPQEGPTIDDCLDVFRRERIRREERQAVRQVGRGTKNEDASSDSEELDRQLMHVQQLARQRDALL